MSGDGQPRRVVDWNLPAECLAAVTGPQRLLELKPKSLTPGDAKRGDALPAKMVTALRSFLTKKENEPQEYDLPEFDYLDLLQKISDPEATGQVRREMLIGHEIQVPELALAYGDVLEQQLSYLDSILPRRQRSTFAGTEPVEPSRQEMGSFARTWQVANNPMHLVRDMNEGCLVTDQVRAMAACYPKLLEAMKKTLSGIAIELKAKKEGWEPTWPKQKVLFTLYQVSPVDPNFANELQQTATSARHAEEKPLDMNLEKSMQTPTQRVADR